MEVLARHKARQTATKEGAGRAEFLGIAEPSRGDRFDLTRAGFLVGDIFARHRGLRHLVLAVGVEPLGQQVVDRHVVARNFEGKPLHRRCLMAGSTARISISGAIMLASIVASQRSRSMSAKLPGEGPALLLTRMSGEGHAASSRA